MPIVNGAPRILVKVRAGTSADRLGAGVDRIGFAAAPLFTRIDQQGQGLAPTATWHILTPSLSLSSPRAWAAPAQAKSSAATGR